MKLEELLVMWKADSVIRQDKLDEESIRTAILHAKYLEIFSAVKMKIYRLKKTLDKLKMTKMRWYNGKLTQEEMDELGYSYDPWNGETRPLKSELENHLSLEEDVLEYSGQIYELEVMRDALVDIISNLNWRHQSIRNSIDYMKFTNGY